MSYEVREHTGELELEIRAPSLARLYAEAALALSREILAREADTATATGPGKRQIEVSASDDEALLVDLLNELIFLSETEGFIAEAVEVDEHRRGYLRATLNGRTHEAVPPLVKAATFHDLSIVEENGVWRGMVVLDV